MIAWGEGCDADDDGGKHYLEGMAGLWSTSLGFSEKRLVEAAAPDGEASDLPDLQRTIDEATIDLAEELLTIAPKGLGKALFANSGSEANDQAVKFVWSTTTRFGRPRKKKIIARMRAITA